MKVKYFIRKGKTERPFINARITHGRALDVRKSLPLTIHHKYWSNEGENIRGRHLPPEPLAVKTKLLEFENALQVAYTETLTTNEPLGLGWVEKVLDGFFTGGKKQERHEYFTDYLEEFIDSLNNRSLPRGNGKKYSYSSVKNYRSTYNRLKEFEGKRKIRLSEVDLRFYDAFVNKHCFEQNALNPNTVGNYIKNIKAILSRAEKEGYVIHPDHKSSDFYKPKSTDPGNEVYLKESEIDSIYSHRCSSNMLSNARDWLILSCETGLRINDLLNPTEISLSSFSYALDRLKSDGWKSGNQIELRLKANKTGIFAIVPLLERSAEILLKNNGLPRSISDVNYNLYLKELCKEVGLNKVVSGSKMMEVGSELDKKSGKKVKRFRKVEGHYPKHELVSSHVGRRSYITNAYVKGVDPYTIMRVSGHRSLDQLVQYIKMTSEDSFDSLQRLHLNNRGDVPTSMVA